MPTKDYLFKEFPSVSEKEWKQLIQMDLKGADYTKTLVWESLEGIHTKPFYHFDSFEYLDIPIPKNDFKIGQEIFIDNPEIANSIAIDAIKNGANAIFFTAQQSFDIDVLFQNFQSLDKEVTIFFKLHFFSEHFIQSLFHFFSDSRVKLLLDPIGHLAQSGNWFENKNSDIHHLQNLISKNPEKRILTVDSGIYQNAGATIVQQIAYTLAHANEYISSLGTTSADTIQFEFAIGSNYFFEIAKIRAFRYLWQQILKKEEIKPAFIIVKPTLRNKTIYDYNVNLLRTATEYMSGILGSADIVVGSAYDHIFKKANKFSKRIARNQLLILKEENYFKNAQTFASGSYYIEALTIELAKKALIIFKDIEDSGGFIQHLKTETIQNKIQQAAEKEQNLFDTGKIVLLGTNKYPNPDEHLKEVLELFPFSKTRKDKTQIRPILSKRLAEKIEKNRLDKE